MRFPLRAFALVTLAGLAIISVSGCTTLDSSGKGPRAAYATGQPFMLSKFEMTITRAHWEDSINPYSNMPGAMAAMGQMAPPATLPQAKFLVIEMSIKNTANRPLTLRSPPVFTLVNSSGVEYITTPSTGGSSLFYRFALGGGINPGMHEDGSEVFDVPKEDGYTLVVSNGSHVGAGRFAKGGTIATIAIVAK